MNKDEFRTLASAASTIFNVLGDGLKAQGYFKEGKGWETVGYSLRAGATIYNGWSDIENSWEIINDHTNKIFTNVESRINQIQRSTMDFILGEYGGIWKNNDGNYEILDHDKNTDLSTLSTQRVNGLGFNFYKGNYLSNKNKFVWTGYNSQNSELVIIGIPSWNRKEIEMLDWVRDGYSGSLKFLNRGVMKK